MKRVFTFDKKIVKFWQGSQCQELKVFSIEYHKCYTSILMQIFFSGKRPRIFFYGIFCPKGVLSTQNIFYKESLNFDSEHFCFSFTFCIEYYVSSSWLSICTKMYYAIKLSNTSTSLLPYCLLIQSLHSANTIKY